MTFNSLSFIVFFGIVCSLMSVSKLKMLEKAFGKKLQTLRHTVLLVASYIFYGYWDFRFAFLMLALTAIAHVCSMQYTRVPRKRYVYIAVISPLVVLGFFKYFNFFVDSFMTAFGIARAGSFNIILPVGISFYTFQTLSYSIDVFKGKLKAERSFLKVALYVSFFPQLVAGPIVKANDFLPQLNEDRNISWKNCKEGIQVFVFGMFKKIVIADNLSVCVDAVFSAPTQYHAVSLIFAVIAYSLQIYCDFSGYSDMAIGCSKCLGYDLQRNFNLPYVSNNVSVFWKRWHISLSSWLMEYVYIPLGGNRLGKRRTYVNLLITMVLGGLWHGANWTFVVWGLLHGIALCIHKIWLKWHTHNKSQRKSIWKILLSVALTYSYVCFCWIFFRAKSFASAVKVIRGILFFQNGIIYISTWTVFSIILIGISTLIPVIQAAQRNSDVEGYYPVLSLKTIPEMTVFFIVAGLILILAYTGKSPFIYFQF